MHCDATACIALIRRWAVRRRRVLQLAEFAPKFVVRAEVVGSRRSSSTAPKFVDWATRCRKTPDCARHRATNATPLV